VCDGRQSRNNVLRQACRDGKGHGRHRDRRGGVARAHRSREFPARAARLLGRADALREETAFGDDEPFETRVRDEAEAGLRARLGEDAYAAAYADGRALTIEDALTLALRPG
jgi:hypothetical protein